MSFFTVYKQVVIQKIICKPVAVSQEYERDNDLVNGDPMLRLAQSAGFNL